MPKNCSVPGCHNLSSRDKHLHYYCLPKVVRNQGEDWQKLTEDRRRSWLAKLNRDLTGINLNNVRICSAHFIKGKKAEHYKRDDPDWVPTVNMPAPAVVKKADVLQPSSSHAKSKPLERDNTPTSPQCKRNIPVYEVKCLDLRSKKKVASSLSTLIKIFCKSFPGSERSVHMTGRLTLLTGRGKYMVFQVNEKVGLSSNRFENKSKTSEHVNISEFQTQNKSTDGLDSYKANETYSPSSFIDNSQNSELEFTDTMCVDNELRNVIKAGQMCEETVESEEENSNFAIPSGYEEMMEDYSSLDNVELQEVKEDPDFTCPDINSTVGQRLSDFIISTEIKQEYNSGGEMCEEYSSLDNADSQQVKESPGFAYPEIRKCQSDFLSSTKIKQEYNFGDDICEPYTVEQIKVEPPDCTFMAGNISKISAANRQCLSTFSTSNSKQIFQQCNSGDNMTCQPNILAEVKEETSDCTCTATNVSQICGTQDQCRTETQDIVKQEMEVQTKT